MSMTCRPGTKMIICFLDRSIQQFLWQSALQPVHQVSLPWRETYRLYLSCSRHTFQAYSSHFWKFTAYYYAPFATNAVVMCVSFVFYTRFISSATSLALSTLTFVDFVQLFLVFYGVPDSLVFRWKSRFLNSSKECLFKIMLCRNHEASHMKINWRSTNDLLLGDRSFFSISVNRRDVFHLPN